MSCTTCRYKTNTNILCIFSEIWVKKMERQYLFQRFDICKRQFLNVDWNNGVFRFTWVGVCYYILAYISPLAIYAQQNEITSSTYGRLFFAWPTHEKLPRQSRWPHGRKVRKYIFIKILSLLGPSLCCKSSFQSARRVHSAAAHLAAGTKSAHPKRKPKFVIFSEYLDDYYDRERSEEFEIPLLRGCAPRRNMPPRPLYFGQPWDPASPICTRSSRLSHMREWGRMIGFRFYLEFILHILSYFPG